MTDRAIPEPRIIRLATEPPLVLHVTWQDGSRTRHDLSPLASGQAWAAALRDPAIFRTAQIQDNGWQIVWPGTDAALSAAGLWDEMHPQPATATWMSAADLTAWLGEMHWSFAQAAEALGVSKRMLKYYAAGTHAVPKTVWLAAMHLAAERARRAQSASVMDTA
jgi:Protein of unknown function (DUF2442)